MVRLPPRPHPPQTPQSRQHLRHEPTALPATRRIPPIAKAPPESPFSLPAVPVGKSHSREMPNATTQTIPSTFLREIHPPRSPEFCSAPRPSLGRFSRGRRQFSAPLPHPPQKSCTRTTLLAPVRGALPLPISAGSRESFPPRLG